MRARLDIGPDGVLAATPLTDQDSSLVTVFAEAEALLRRGAGADAIDAGEIADVLRLDRLA
jgi:molybdopterin molybdotransferase